MPSASLLQCLDDIELFWRYGNKSSDLKHKLFWLCSRISRTTDMNSNNMMLFDLIWWYDIWYDDIIWFDYLVCFDLIRVYACNFVCVRQTNKNSTPKYSTNNSAPEKQKDLSPIVSYVTKNTISLKISCTLRFRYLLVQILFQCSSNNN